MPSVNPKSKAEQRFLLSKHIPYELKAARGPLAVALQLGGLPGLLLMALCRERQGIYSTLCEAQELKSILKWCMFQIEKAERAAKAGEPSLAERAKESHARIVERAKRERERQERYLERCAGRPSGNPAVIKSECRVIRPSDQVVDQVLAEMTAQGPSPEVEEESTPVVEERSSTHNWSTACKGEMGVRLAFNIDRVLQEIRGPVLEDETLWPDDNAEELKLHRSTDALLEEIRLGPSVDPPTEVCDLDAGAGGNEVLPVAVEEVAGAASTIATEPSPLDGDSAWSLLCAVPDFAPSDLEELSSALDQHPEMHSIALVAAITRAKLTLSNVSSWTAPDAPLEIGAGDLVVLLRSALRGVR